MQDNVYQVHGEPRKRGEFERTMEALERYAGRFYPMDTVLLQPLFKDLSESKVTLPKIPSQKKNEEEGIKVEAELISEDVSKWDKIMFIEEKQKSF